MLLYSTIGFLSATSTHNERMCNTPSHIGLNIYVSSCVLHIGGRESEIEYIMTVIGDDSYRSDGIRTAHSGMYNCVNTLTQSGQSAD